MGDVSRSGRRATQGVLAAVLLAAAVATMVPTGSADAASTNGYWGYVCTAYGKAYLDIALADGATYLTREAAGAAEEALTFNYYAFILDYYYGFAWGQGYYRQAANHAYSASTYAYLDGAFGNDASAAAAYFLEYAYKYNYIAWLTGV